MKYFSIKNDNSRQEDFRQAKKKLTSILNEDDNQVKIIYIAYVFFFIYLAVLLLRYALAIYGLQPKVINNNLFFIIFFGYSPILLWIYMTKYDFYNFFNRKKRLLYFITVNAIATNLQPVYSLSWRCLVVPIMKIKISRTVTAPMIVNLARISLILVMVTLVTVIVMQLKPFLFSQEALERLMYVKLRYIFDIRKNHKNLYDLRIIKNLETGEDIVIKENDRFAHMFITGSSGTGKTSTIYTNAIKDDLNMKLKNSGCRQKALFHMVQQGKAGFKKEFTHFKESYIVAREGYEEELNQIYDKYKDCGITVQAPNGSLNEELIKLADARNLTVNLIDPTIRENPYSNVNLIGLNPFALPLDENGEYTLTEDLTILIQEKAKVFAQVLVALYSLSGKSDQYFESVNKDVTANVAIVHMLDSYLSHKQTDIFEIQRSINKFSNLKEPVERIEKKLGFTVVIDDYTTKKASYPSANSKRDAVDDATAEGLIQKQLQEEAERKSPFYLPLYTVKQELLGAGQEDLFKQARGLRILINDFLNDPRIRRVFDTDDVLNFDYILANNEITLINTALEYGESNSKALGLFFMLNFKNAVTRRPKDKRSNHFYYIDEGPQYLHPDIETMWTLLRQYRCAIAFDTQTLAQLGRSQETAFLKDTMMSAAIHILFGRCSPEEMEVYSKLAGIEKVDLRQESVSHNSLLSEDPSLTMSERTSQTSQNVKEGRDLRKRDFLELTLFSVDEGRVLDAVLGKVNFLNKKELLPKKTLDIDWNKLYEHCKYKNLGAEPAKQTILKEGFALDSDEAEEEAIEEKEKLEEITIDEREEKYEEEEAEFEEEYEEEEAEIEETIVLTLPKQIMPGILTKQDINKKIDAADAIISEVEEDIDISDFDEFFDFM